MRQLAARKHQQPSDENYPSHCRRGARSSVNRDRFICVESHTSNACPELGNDIQEHGEKVADAPTEDEDVPDRVMERQASPDEEDHAQCVRKSADKE
jgi:hypothetical protein